MPPKLNLWIHRKKLPCIYLEKNSNILQIAAGFREHNANIQKYQSHLLYWKGITPLIFYAKFCEISNKRKF